MLKGCKLNECDQTWESLKAIDSKTSYCERCKEAVYKVDSSSSSEIYGHLDLGHCVAFETTVGTLKAPESKD